MVKKTIPFHVYLSGIKNGEDAAALVLLMQKTGVRSLWLDANSVEKIIVNLLPAEKNRASGFSNDLHFFVVVRNKKTLGSFFKNIEARSEKKTPPFSLGIAVSPSQCAHVLGHTELIKKHRISICLVSENFYSPGKRDFFQSLTESEQALKLLYNRGVKEVSVFIDHPDPVVFFNACRQIKEKTGAWVVAPFSPCENEKNCLIRNAVILGSVFSESVADELLVFPPSGEQFFPAVSEAKKTLSSCQVFPRGYTIISCPMCGRCMLDIETLTKTIETRLPLLEKQYIDAGRRLEDIGGITVAVMGCSVNGPGEAREADIGVAGAKKNRGVLFMDGKPFKTVPQEQIVEELLSHTKALADERFKEEKNVKNSKHS